MARMGMPIPRLSPRPPLDKTKPAWPPAPPRRHTSGARRPEGGVRCGRPGAWWSVLLRAASVRCQRSDGERGEAARVLPGGPKAGRAARGGAARGEGGCVAVGGLRAGSVLSVRGRRERARRGEAARVLPGGPKAGRAGRGGGGAASWSAFLRAGLLEGVGRSGRGAGRRLQGCRMALDEGPRRAEGCRARGGSAVSFSGRELWSVRGQREGRGARGGAVRRGCRGGAGMGAAARVPVRRRDLAGSGAGPAPPGGAGRAAIVAGADRGPWRRRGRVGPAARGQLSGRAPARWMRALRLSGTTPESIVRSFAVKVGTTPRSPRIIAS